MRDGGSTARSSDPAQTAQLRVVDQALTNGGEELGSTGFREHIREWKPVYIAFLLSRLVVFLAGFGAEIVMRSMSVDPIKWRPFIFAETYPHYADVATNGYTAENAVNHPLLPAIMAGGDMLGIPLWLTGMLISNVAFLIGLVGIAMLGERYIGREASIRGATYLAFAPFAYWFSVTSTESILLALLAGSVLLALRASTAAWLGAGALGAFAVLCRPPGALVGILLLAIAISQIVDERMRGARMISAALAAGMMIPAALVAFFAYMGARTGDALASMHAQKDFNRELSLDGPVRALASGFNNALSGSIGQAIEVIATLGAAALIVLFATRAAGNRWEIRGWTGYSVASLLLPLATGVLWQMPRFVLLIPPVFWILGQAGRRRTVNAAIIGLFCIALVVKTITAVVGVEG